MKKKRKVPKPSNLGHFMARLRGGRVHTDKSKLIPRKQKYKNMD